MHEKGHHTRPSATFECSEEDADDVDLFGGCYGCHEACEDSPANFEAREPEGGAHVGEDDLGRDEHEAVGDVD